MKEDDTIQLAKVDSQASQDCVGMDGFHVQPAATGTGRCGRLLQEKRMTIQGEDTLPRSTGKARL